MTYAIRASGLGKQYTLGQRGAAFPTLRDAIAKRARAGTSAPKRERFWALHDLSFDLEQGTALGVIGHNGAGKTTLLKILSKITPPSEGEALVAGRVGSLLEVGTGFHPELTGRENVFLNGAILGMRRREIQAKFDEIVAFAEVERFIDTPVKRYSTGMYVRLAFSVAAHLEPDILIVDEVLAVGDVAFQRKCLGKMGEVAGVGRTVLLVSHNMTAIRSLTQRAIWLEQGRLVQDGPTEHVVGAYLSSLAEDAAGYADLSSLERRRSAKKRLAGDLRFESVALRDASGACTARLPEGEPMELDIHFSLQKPLRYLETIARVRTTDGTLLFSCFSGQHEGELPEGTYVVRCSLPHQPLRPGRYVLELTAVGTQIQDNVPAALTFEIEAGHLIEDNPRYTPGADDGVIRVASSWTDFEPAPARPVVSVESSQL